MMTNAREFAMKKIGMTIVLGLGCFLLQTSLASPPVCVVQFAKDVCWQSHRVTLHVYDVKQFKDVGPPIVLTKDASFIEASFPCQAGQNITFKASFLPEMWGSEKTSFIPEQTNLECPDEVC